MTTAEFAVESVRRWWRWLGGGVILRPRDYCCAPMAGEVMAAGIALGISLAAIGGSVRLDVTVCHYPPGTSKWNKIEHRMFSFISLKLAGQAFGQL